MTRFPAAKLCLAVLMTLATLLPMASPAAAQGLFAPVAKVNDRVVTRYELDQRATMLRLLRTPGNVEKLALEQLIDDRLKLDAAAQFKITASDEDVRAGMEEFAQRANLDADQFIAALGQNGVSEQTFRDFVRPGLMWRELVRGRFGARVNISDDEIDKAIANSGGTGASSLRVLLSEIFIPAPQGQEAQAQALADELSQITSFDGFARAAREYSAAPTGAAGGRINWMQVSNLPPALRPVILGLKPGEVTPPLPVQGAIALFQLRAIEEGPYSAPDVTEIEYAAYYIAGGRSPEALARAAKVRAQVDTCNDLYGIAKGQPESVLERGSKKPGEIPQDIAIELAKLDANEVSTALTRSNGQTLVFLMLCNRKTASSAGDLNRRDVLTRLQNERIGRYAETYLSQLRSEAQIEIY